MAGCCKVCLNRGVFWSEKKHHITVKVSYPTWVDIEQSLFDSQALQYHCFNSISTKNPNKKKMRFTSLPTKSESSPSQISPPLLPRSRWDNNFAVPMCGPWWRCHGSSYLLDLKVICEIICSWVKWLSNGSVKSNRGSIKSIDVILHRSFGVRHWGVPYAATLVWPPGGNNRLLVGSGW